MVIRFGYWSYSLFYDKAVLSMELNKVRRKVIAFCALIAAFCLPAISSAQCAMCRTQVVNNVSHGETSLAAGLNLGILYLFFTPYIAIAVIALLWFKYSKKYEPKESIASRLRRQMSQM